MIGRAAWLLGAVSLLNDAASEMVLPFLPVFLAGTLGASVLAAGAVEGIAEGGSAVLKWVGGRVADRTGRTRALLVSGYALPALARPLLALASGPAAVLGLRVLDRVGKGLRTAPRDAVLAASVDVAWRARAFSLHRSMDHAGAVVGALAAWAILQRAGADLRVLFAWSFVPGVLAVALLAAGAGLLRAGAPPAPPAARSPPSPPAAPAPRRVLPLATIAALGRPSEAFVLLAAERSGCPLPWLPILWGGLHVVKAATSPLGGALGDRLGPRPVVAAAWAVGAAAYAIVAASTGASLAGIAAGTALLGLAAGLGEGPERALVAVSAGAGGGASRFGAYHALQGGAVLAANVVLGAAWDRAGAAFAFSAVAVPGIVAGGVLAAAGAMPRPPGARPA